MSRDLVSRQGKHFTFLQINDKEFLVEGNIGNTRISGESEYAITAIDLDGGPFIHLGQDFLGRGIVSLIDMIDTESKNNLMLRIVIKPKD